MNVLAPVAQDERLTVAGIFQGFKTGEFTVRTPEQRARAMGAAKRREAGAPPQARRGLRGEHARTSRKEVKPHQLIVVHSKEIDDAGEANVGLPDVRVHAASRSRPPGTTFSSRA